MTHPATGRCPACDRKSLVPHCANPDCTTTWCHRGACSWDNGDCATIAPEPHPWQLEQPIGGPAKAWYKPVPSEGRWIGRHPQGFVFDFLSEHPDWPPKDLYAMCVEAAEFIAAFPTTDPRLGPDCRYTSRVVL